MEIWQEQTLSPVGTGSEPGPDSGPQGGFGAGPGSDLTSVRFAQVARQLNQEAKRHGLSAPSFRSPPRVPGVSRSIRRRTDGSATVSVSLRGRPAVAVVADMIEGVMAANEPCSTRSSGVRDRLWSAATPFLLPEVDGDRSQTPRAA